MNAWKHLPRLAAAAAFAGLAMSAVVVTEALHAGTPAAGIFSAAPRSADAAVNIGIGINIGQRSYPRYAYRGGRWVRVGFAYAAAPGWAGGYYYGAPPYGYVPPVAVVRPVYLVRPGWRRDDDWRWDRDRRWDRDERWGSDRH